LIYLLRLPRFLFFVFHLLLHHVLLLGSDERAALLADVKERDNGRSVGGKGTRRGCKNRALNESSAVAAALLPPRVGTSPLRSAAGAALAPAVFVAFDVVDDAVVAPGRLILPPAPFSQALIFPLHHLLPRLDGGGGLIIPPGIVPSDGEHLSMSSTAVAAVKLNGGGCRRRCRRQCRMCPLCGGKRRVTYWHCDSFLKTFQLVPVSCASSTYL